MQYTAYSLCIREHLSILHRYSVSQTVYEMKSTKVQTLDELVPLIDGMGYFYSMVSR